MPSAARQTAVRRYGGPGRQDVGLPQRAEMVPVRIVGDDGAGMR